MMIDDIDDDMSLICLLLVYDQQTHITLMKDHRVVVINFNVHIYNITKLCIS